MPTTGFANGTGIPTIPDASSAVMQSFVLSGAVGRITGVSITLSGLSHAVPDDLDFVLFGPLARSNLVFWSDVGGSGGFSFGHFTISDAGATALPDGPFTTFGQPFKPANYGTPPETAANFGAVSTDLNHPETSGSATFYTAFSGVDPNGTWMLYVRDDTGANFGSLSGWSVSITTAAVAADFDRNLVKDILWRHDDGTVVAWLLNSGGGFTTRALGAPDASWRIAETGDFNNDARSDILWRNNDGTVVSWLLNASGIGATQTLGAPDNSWRIAETADFNYDGRSDILWRNDDGTVVIWLMNETSGLVSQTVGNPGTAWHINEVGDFNADGRSDILWRHNDGTVVLWLLHEANGLATQSLGNPGPGWRVEGTGYFDGNRTADILWRHTDGTTSIWLLDGNGGIVGRPLASPDNAWQVEDVGDFNGDAIDDVLWRHTDGTIIAWVFDPASKGFASVAVGTTETAWHIQNDPTGIV